MSPWLAVGQAPASAIGLHLVQPTEQAVGWQPSQRRVDKGIILNMTDYYNLLGVRFAAKPDEIRSAFRRQAKQAHPDANPHLVGKEKEAMQQRFVLLAQAYETLSDPTRRREYDRIWRAKQQAQQQTQGPRPTSGTGARSTGTRPGGTGSARNTAGQTHRTTPGARPQTPPHNQPPPDMGEMMDEVEELLGRFGVDMRNQFGVMLDKMLDWALAVFMEVVQNLEGERAKNQTQEQEAPRPKPNSQGGSTGFEQQARPRPRPQPRATEQDLEAELAALKNQINSAVHKAKQDQEESVEEELARIKAASQPKK